jgi:hypothetical protein
MAKASAIIGIRTCMRWSQGGPDYIFLERGKFFQKHGNIAMEYFLFIFIFRILVKFCTQKILRGGSH